jgi:hypothetical protein
MNNTITKEAATLYQTMLDLVSQVPGLQDAAAHGPLEGVMDAQDKLIAVLMSIRTVARSLSELDSERAVCLWIIEEQMTREILKVIQLPVAVATAAGR